MARTRIFLLTAGLWLISSQAHAMLYLSDYLGVPSGSAAFDSNDPFTTLISAPNGIGADTAGGYTNGELIELNDRGEFTKGLGAGPVSEVTFHLGELPGFGTFDRFNAVIGIDPKFQGTEGGDFFVDIDGSNALTQRIANVTSASVDISVDVTQASDLTLRTTFINIQFGNNTVWADAHLTTAPVPLPPAFGLFAAAVLVIQRIRKTPH